MNPILPTLKLELTLPELVARLSQEGKHVNKNRNKLNQPPTGQGKKQSPRSGEANKLNKRSEVLQAAGAEQNIGTAEEEDALRSQQQSKKRAKAGR
jgi:hypothetical protein